MNYRKKLFVHRKPYDLAGTNHLFLKAVQENVLFHQTHCETYARILMNEKFHIDSLDSIESLYKIPVIPTLYLKRAPLYSMEENRFVVQVTSSGTSGMQSRIGIDRTSMYYGIRMALAVFAYHKLISGIPTNYVVLGYEPSGHSQAGAIKTAYGATKFAPALHRVYALKDTGSGYQINLEGMEKALAAYYKSGFPVRFVGFPAYMLYLIKTLQKNNIKFRLNGHSRVILGGGWKQFSSDRVDRKELYDLIGEVMGLRESSCREFFSAVEHPIAYCACENHHFHVPIYSRVIIRDVKTLLPVRMGEVGLLSFVTPLMESVPLVSIVTDDLAVLHEARECGCKIASPYFTLHGRVEEKGIKTCAAGAVQMMKGIGI